MIKTLSKAQKMEREKFRIPRSVQDAIPIRRIFADGIFQVGNRYSKTWSFTDINYAIAGKEDKTAMFLDYSELLNALDSGASAKITIYNRRINKAEFERSVLLPDRDDGLDEYRHEFNKMLTAQVTGTSNSIVRERYLTVSVVKRNADEARSYFSRVGTDLVTHLAQLSSVATELTLNERLHIFRDFFKAGEQAAAEFNIHEHARRGQHFKDWLCPDSMEFAADHFKIDARFGRVLYLQDYASYIKDSFVSELCDLDRDLMLSILKICRIKLHGKRCKAICLQICRKSKQSVCRRTFPRFCRSCGENVRHGIPSVQSARPIAVKKGKTHHAGKKESLVGLAAAATTCMVGGAGGGLPLAAGHENNGSAGCTEQRTGRAVCVGVESRQPALFACVYGDLRGSAYRGCVGSEEHPPRRGAWLGGVGRRASAE